MRKRDADLNTQLQGNIEQLNLEILERESRACHLELLEQLKQEMKYREQTQIELSSNCFTFIPRCLT